MTGKQQLGEELLTPGAVAALLFVDRKTVARWVQTGKLDAIRTPGGHHRFRASDVAAIRDGTYERRAPASEGILPSPGTEDAEPSAEALAAAVVSEAVAVALEAEAADAVRADELLREQALAAADRAAAAAHRAAGARAFAAEQAARTVARDASRTATRVQIRADVAASQVAAAASAALEQLLAEGEDVTGGKMAILAADAGAAAELTARDALRAAVVVSAAVAEAAALVARTTARAEVAYAEEVARAARELRTTADEAATRRRVHDDARAAGVALAAREAAAGLHGADDPSHDAPARGSAT